MKTQHIFTAEEMRRLERMPHIAFIEEMEAGNFAKAKEWIEQLIPLYRYTFDLRVRWDDQLMRCIFDNAGADAVYELMRFCGFKKDEIAKLRITPEDEAKIREHIESLDVNLEFSQNPFEQTNRL